MDAADIDLLDRDRFTAGHPARVVHLAARERPGVPPRRARRARVLGDHEARRRHPRATATPASFSSDGARGGVVGARGARRSAGPRPSRPAASSCCMMDPPDHTRYRKLVNRGFTPAHDRPARDRTSASSPNGILDEALAKGEGDFVVDVAAELPLEVIAELIGVPSEDRHKIFEWSNRMIGSEDPEYQVTDEEIFNAQVEMFMYAQQLAEKRRAEPARRHHHRPAQRRGRRRVAVGHGLQPVLPAAVGGRQRDDPQRHLPRHERVPREPRPVGRCWRPTPTAASTGATEEILRWASPVMYFRRNATQGLRARAARRSRRATRSASGTSRPTGTRTCSTTRSAFDITRDAEPHIAFGGGGPHFCLGAQLARMEIQVLFEELAKRVAARRGARRARPPALQLHRRHQAPAGALPPPLGAAARQLGVAGGGGGEVAGRRGGGRCSTHQRADEHERGDDEEARWRGGPSPRRRPRSWNWSAMKPISERRRGAGRGRARKPVSEKADAPQGGGHDLGDHHGEGQQAADDAGHGDGLAGQAEPQRHRQEGRRRGGPTPISSAHAGQQHRDADRRGRAAGRSSRPATNVPAERADEDQRADDAGRAAGAERGVALVEGGGPEPEPWQRAGRRSPMPTMSDRRVRICSTVARSRRTSLKAERTAAHGRHRLRGHGRGRHGSTGAAIDGSPSGSGRSLSPRVGSGSRHMASARSEPGTPTMQEGPAPARASIRRAHRGRGPATAPRIGAARWRAKARPAHVGPVVVGEQRLTRPGCRRSRPTPSAAAHGEELPVAAHGRVERRDRRPTRRARPR